MTGMHVASLLLELNSGSTAQWGVQAGGIPQRPRRTVFQQRCQLGALAACFVDAWGAPLHGGVGVHAMSHGKRATEQQTGSTALALGTSLRAFPRSAPCRPA